MRHRTSGVVKSCPTTHALKSAERLAGVLSIFMGLVVEPIHHGQNSDVHFGAQVKNVDLTCLSDEDFREIESALYEHLLLVFKHQDHLKPEGQLEFTRRFDPGSRTFGVPDDVLHSEKSILRREPKIPPKAPQVHIIGHGQLDEYEGLKNVKLVHPTHHAFHRDPLPLHEQKYTRFLRWHMDAALYGVHPPVATTLYAVVAPEGRQIVRYDDGSGEELETASCATAFVSGETMYERLSPQEKEFADQCYVEYAPQPFMWTSRCRSFNNGLGVYTEGRELPESELPSIDQEKVQVLPMVWKNPRTGRKAVQVHPCVVKKLHVNGEVIEDLKKVREILYQLQRPAIRPSFVYAHPWESGDLVVFYDRGLMHSVTGVASSPRVMRQCSLSGSAGLAQ